MIKRVDKKSEDAVVTDQAQKKMKEIVYDEQKHTVVDAKFNFKEVLDSFLEKTRAEAEALLKQLVSEKKISEFRLNPIGVAVTEDYKPSRISVTLDASGKVVEAQQG